MEIAVSPLPALSNGHVTFGSFNNLVKMNDAVVALWARVLVSVPGSKLLLKAKQFREDLVLQRVIERFAAHGVGAERLILMQIVPRAEYLAPYQQVDIALDTFPYPGITTSVEALWMGVPVLTLAGESFLSRQGVGLLMNAGLPEWIAADADDYVARAVSHASDLQRLAALRKGLRQQVLASPIFDAPRFAHHFEAALRGMWQKWCDTDDNSRETSGTDFLARPMNPQMMAMENSRMSIPTRHAMNGITHIGNDKMKLHIGGKEPKAGWKILNALDFEGVDFVGNVCDLSAFPDACCEKVYASHVMEHVGQRDFVSTLKGIQRILCDNGEFYFSVPDLEVLCRLFLNPELDESQRFQVMRRMFGGQTNDYDFHYIGLTYEFMMNFFNQAGFSSVKRVASFGLFSDTSDYKLYGVPISLNLIATK
jgi:predicted SAM-dependent methyltransferase